MSPDSEALKARIKLEGRRLARKLGDQGRRLREEQNLSQTAMEKGSGLIRHAISRFEYGSTTPTISTLLRIAAGLGMDLHIEFVPKPTTQKEE